MSVLMTRRKQEPERLPLTSHLWVSPRTRNASLAKGQGLLFYAACAIELYSNYCPIRSRLPHPRARSRALGELAAVIHGHIRIQMRARADARAAAYDDIRVEPHVFADDSAGFDRNGGPITALAAICAEGSIVALGWMPGATFGVARSMKVCATRAK